jgi:hypothetical protein
MSQYQFSQTSPTPQTSSTMDKVMNQSVKCGKFAGISSGVICIIIILIFCGVGIKMYNTKNNAVYQQVPATVTEANCSQVVSSSGRSTSISYNCSLKVKYNINGEEYLNTVVSNDTVHNVNEVINLYYNTENPNDIKYSYMTNQNMGKILIGVGASFVLLFTIHVVLTMKSDWYNRFACLGAVSKAVGFGFRS